jgi:hypothetical protein
MSKWEKLSVAELKARLKGAGLSAAGDKATLQWRIGLSERVEQCGLRTQDGRKPTELKPAEVSE